LLRARKLDIIPVEMPPDTLEDFLTKAGRWRTGLLLGVRQRLPCLFRFSHLTQGDFWVKILFF
jgi:hypothetical protein